MSDADNGPSSKPSAKASSASSGDQPSAHRPILSFGVRGPSSQRGRGRGGRGRGRGMVWSGRTGNVSSSSTMTYSSRGGRGRGRGRGNANVVSGRSNTWTRGQASSTTKPAVGSVAPACTSNRWVRPKESAETNEDNDTETVEEMAEKITISADEKQDNEDTSAFTKTETKSNEEINGNGNAKAASSDCNAEASMQDNSESIKKKPILKGGPKTMAGSHVWRRKSDDSDDGNNGNAKAQPRPNKQQNPPARHLPAKGNGKAGRDANRRGMKPPAAKRIRLDKGGSDAASKKDGKDNGNGGNIDDVDMPNGSKKQDADAATLTAFAYRETGPTGRGRGRGGRGRGRGRGGSTSGAGSNKGLVRVKSELQSTTKICPTFARGINCDDEYCRKRHDVPPECARPLCSFFQRHGQCRKGDDCPFAHVKVDPRAAVCSSFRLLGYCEDPKCAFKHVLK